MSHLILYVSAHEISVLFGRMRDNSALSQVSLSQVGTGQLGPVISYIAYYFHEGYQ